jgi:GTPase SAR1 family protein
MAVDLGAEALAREASDLETRLGEGRFFVACVGQFKRGKSTLLNALIGQPILPTGVVPVTTVLTVLRYGPTLGARVRVSDGRELDVDPGVLGDYVTEARNPANEKGVATVEVTFPSRLLASGMCLVDTPGLGSVFAANSATTQAFVPHIDAALVVLGSDPPISSEELALVENMGRQVEEILFVLNKSDRVADADSQEAAAFTARTIAKRVDRDIEPIFRVSAAERIVGRVTRDWAQLEAALIELAGRSGAVLDAAAERGVARISRELLREIAEQRDALLRPVGESERRLDALRRAIAEAEFTLKELSARLQVEHFALSERFADAQHAFLARAIPDARQELAAAVAATTSQRGPAARAAAMDAALRVARRRVTAWAEHVEPEAEAMYAATMARFVEIANDFIRRLASGASSGPAIEAGGISGERGFREGGRFFFTSLLTLTDPGLWTWLFDWVRSHRSRIASSIRHASRYLERLIRTNSARLANDLSARVAGSERRLESEIRERLSTLAESAQRALNRARAQQAAGAEAVRAELVRLDDLRRRVERLGPNAAHAANHVTQGNP